jgi:hypothetical protein
VLGSLLGLSVSIGAASYRRKFISQARRAQEVNDAFLAEVLLRNQGTAFGQQHGFSRIATPRDYRAALPLTTYPDYEPYVDRIARGEPNVLTAEPVCHLGQSSGTTGRQKLIPITRSAQRQIALSMVFLVQGMLDAALPGAGSRGRGLLMMSAGSSGRTAAGITMGSATSAGLSSMLRMSRWMWTTPADAMVLTDQPQVLHLHLLFALKERGLPYLSATFASSIMDLFHLLERDWPVLVDELASGKLSPELRVPEPARARLERTLGACPERAREIRSGLERGMEGIARRLWPRLSHVNAVTGGSFAVYARKLRGYLGDVPLFSSVYASTEALIGVGMALESTTYAVVPGAAYFELIPAGEVDSPSPSTVTLEEAAEGDSYEVVLTNRSGLYRYRLGDMVKVVGRYHRTPVVEFLYRRGQLLNLAAEKTSEQAVLAALLEASSAWGMPLVDFTTLADYDAAPARYVFFVEVKDPAALARLPDAGATLDQALGRANPRYQVARDTGRLGSPVLHPVQQDTFAQVKGLLIRRGASANQVKIPRVVSADDVIQLLRQKVLAR